jgi:hypothetical protein
MRTTTYPSNARAPDARRDSTDYPVNTRASDVPPHYLDPHPWRWLGAFACAIALYFIVLATAGHLING